MLARGASGSGADGVDWRCPFGDDELSLEVRGAAARLFSWGSLALLIRGYVRPAGTSGPLDLEGVAQELRCRYLEANDLAVDGLEGSFSVALLDGRSGRVHLYRNLVGAGFTYYHAGRDGFRFGSNLATLVEAARVTPRENLLALPTYFLFRFVPGAETLFDGFFRVLPGEQITWDGRVTTRRQRHSFADLLTSTINGDAIAAVDETTARVLVDCAAHHPDAANLLSGGVDSSYLQAVWNRVGGAGPPRSFSVSVEHPRSRPDNEYALTAAQALDTDHTTVPADGPYADYLVDLLASTGEPPNHVQSAYFGRLARALRAEGVGAALCGEGADSLFGLGLANQIHNAGVVRRLLPLGLLRKTAAAVSGALGFGRVAATCRLADRLTDYAALEHPVNRVAAFADWPAVEACFGREAVHEAAAGRRAILDRLRVSDDPLDRLHAAGYLGEATDSASLWTTLFNCAGADLLCPFLDSRMLRLALNLPRDVRYAFRKPKDLLKRALAQHVGAEMAQRPKLGFGQPIFEWLAPDGQLRHLVERLGRHGFVEPATFDRALWRPNWFLYSLLCYDLWHRVFIERSLSPGDVTPRSSKPAREHERRGARR
jgi:asparagine synthase (glutamine-hydrolysing)